MEPTSKKLILPQIEPTTLADIIGQVNIIQELTTQIMAFRRTGMPMPHAILKGFPGVGKTTITRAFANTMGVCVHELTGQSLKTEDDVIRLISRINHGDIVFIDELHQVSEDAQEKLLTILEGFYYITENSQTRQHERCDVPRFTMIGATTDFGKLRPAFKDRCVSLDLSRYSIEELAIVVERSCFRAYGITMPDDVAEWIAQISRNTPRRANQLMAALVRYAEAAKSDGDVESEDLTLKLLFSVCRSRNIDVVIGLDCSSRRYLSKLVAKFGKAMGAKTLAAIAGEDMETIENDIEPFLMSDIEMPIYRVVEENGDLVMTYERTLTGPLIEKTERGRVATENAQEYIRMCKELQLLGYMSGEHFD